MEATPGRFGTVIAEHRNSQGELATIERQPTGAPFEGQSLLCFYDEASPTVAPMLLDDATVTWLLAELGDIEPTEARS